MKRFLFRIGLLIFFMTAHALFYPEISFSKGEASSKGVSDKAPSEKEDVVANRAVKLVGIAGKVEVQDLKDKKDKVKDLGGIIISGAQNSKGDLYVLKNFPSKVLAFNKKGEFLFSFGEIGDKAGQFRQPFSIAMDNQDMVYVCDAERGKVMVFTPVGEFLEEFSSKSAMAKSDKYKEANPGCISINKKNNQLYISDPANGHIWVYNLDGKFLRYFKGKESGLFCTPGTVTFDQQNRIYVAEGMCDRVRVFHEDGSDLFTIGGESGDAVGQFSRLTGVALDSQGRIYTSDLLLKCIQVFSAEGIFIGAIKWFDRGKEKTYFKRPTGIFAGQDDNIFILDQGSNQIYIIKDENK